jgi:hypothetical protein
VTAAVYAPKLARVPDARKAPFPLLDPVLLAYLSLVMGAPLCCLAGFVNGIALRRARLALLALGLGVVGWFGFWAVAEGAYRGGLRELPLVILAARAFHIAIGALLAWSQWAHLRGHQFLDGRTVPTLGGVVIATAAALALPTKTLLWLWGLPVR